MSFITKATKDKILDMVKNTKYFSIIVDCTPDFNHKEPMSVVHYVHIEKAAEGVVLLILLVGKLKKFFGVCYIIGTSMTCDFKLFASKRLIY